MPVNLEHPATIQLSQHDCLFCFQLAAARLDVPHPSQQPDIVELLNPGDNISEHRFSIPYICCIGARPGKTFDS
jgi:hypothetical protein